MRPGVPQQGGFFTRFYDDSHQWEGPYPRWAEDWMRAENEAVTLRIWQPLIIPGLLQTAEYARALFLGDRSDLGDDALDRLVAARLERQRIFDRDDPPHVSVLLDESVLHRLIGTPQVMHDQLVRVAEMSARSHISVQVVPGSVGAHPGLAGAFMIAGCEDKPDIMYIDAVGGTDDGAQRSRSQIRYSIRPHQKRGTTRKRIARNDLEGGRGTMEVIANLRWRKSTFSGNGGPDCLEVANRAGHVLVRDTKQDGHGPVLQLSVAAWRRFVAERKTTP